MAGTGAIVDFPNPVVSGQNVTVDRYLNDPKRIYRALRTMVQQRLIGDKVLTGRWDLTGSGSGVYEVAEAIVPDYLPLVVPALTEYPETTFTPGTPASVQPVKWGQGFEMSDKVIAHNRIDLLMRNLKKIANGLVKNSDTITLAAVASAVTQTSAGFATWGGTTSTPFMDVENAIAIIDTLNLGYTADTVVLTPTKFAQLMGSTSILGNTPRNSNDGSNVTLTGNIQQIAGLTIMKTTNMPSGWLGMVLDSSMLGSQVYEDLGSVGGVKYNGTPGDVESATFGLPERDGKRVQARIVKAPIIQEPGAAVRLTGI